MKKSIKLLKARNCEWSLEGVDGNNNAFLIHSAENPSVEGTNWANYFSQDENTLNVILGVGLGYHVLSFYEQIPSSSKVLIILSNEEGEWLSRLKERTPIRKIQNGEIAWVVSEDTYDISISIAEFMLENYLKKIRFCPYQPGMKINYSFYVNVLNNLPQLIENSMGIFLNVRFLGGKLFLNNYFTNLFWIAKNPGIDQFLNLFSPNTPVVIVGSGPSLDKNINDLQKMQKNCVVIAAGSAMAALKKANIVPHILCVVDPTDKMYEVIKDSFFSETVLLVSAAVNHKIVANYPGRMIFFNSNDTPKWKELRQLLPKTRALMQAASVSTCAVDFARLCGSRKIILVGQDLSYPNGEKHHAEGVNTGSYSDKEIPVMVPGYYGNEVVTYKQLKVIIDFFASFAGNFPQIDFINATEGGAHIGNFRQQSLNEIAQALEGTNWGEVIERKIDKYYNNYETKKIRKIMTEIKVMAEKLQEYGAFLEKSKELIQTRQNCLNEEIKEYKDLFEGEIAHNVAAVLEDILKSRLQTIEFYRQENTSDEEIHAMYTAMLEDISLFCLREAEVLFNTFNKIDEELLNVK